jgi:hypothetical protein
MSETGWDVPAGPEWFPDASKDDAITPDDFARVPELEKAYLDHTAQIERLTAERDAARDGRVKPLEWVVDGHDGMWGNGVFNYRVRQKGPGIWWWQRAMIASWYQPEHETTLEAAKAAAQADYESRILAALEKPE